MRRVDNLCNNLDVEFFIISLIKEIIMSLRILRPLYYSLFIFLFSCSVQKQISHLAKENVLDNASLQTAHIGITVYDPSKNQYLYNYQSEKYFVPASNTKLF